MAEFEIAGKELDWPLIAAAGMTNHPSIEMVSHRLDDITATGVSVVTLGSWTLGNVRTGNGYEEVEPGKWDHVRTDEYVDTNRQVGYNAKGLPNPGTDLGLEHLTDLIDVARSRDVEVAVSLSPHSGEPVEELKELYEVGRKALKKGALYVELNLSCPNVPGKPAFFQDIAGVMEYREFANSQQLLTNNAGELALYEKFGPFRGHIDRAYGHLTEHLRGIVTANTVGGQRPTRGLAAQPIIEVNGGNAGMSGPELAWLGRMELAEWAELYIGKELISSLGVSTGREVHMRRLIGANVVQLASAIYWPELTGNETSQQAVQQIKDNYVEATIGSW